MFVLHGEIGDKPIELDKAFNQKIGDRVMNLRIKCRLLIDTSKLIRCRYCTSPVIDTMVPKFESRYNGDEWKCNRVSCSNLNVPERSRCVNCHKCIPQDQTANMRESIFNRYERLTRDEILKDEGLNEEALQALGVNGWSL